MCFLWFTWTKKTHGGGKRGLCEPQKTHKPQKGPPCVFVVHVIHIKHMVEANVVYVNHIKHINHKNTCWRQTWFVWTTKNIWWNHLWFMWFLWFTWTTFASTMWFLWLNFFFLHESNFSILFYTNQIPPLRILRSAGCTTGRGLTCEPLPVNPHPWALVVSPNP